jgi:hypothetical protein
MGSFKQMTHVIEVATFDLQPGVNVEDFKKLDLLVKTEYIAIQPGYMSRISGFDQDKWVVIVHWKSVEEADASMSSFMTALPAKEFMRKLDVSTMKMSRYITAN